MSTKEKREGASSQCLQPILAALTREQKTSEDERKEKWCKVVESSTVMVEMHLKVKKVKNWCERYEKMLILMLRKKKDLANNSWTSRI